MDRWKRRGGQSQRREEQKGEDQSRERVRRKKMQVRENVEKSRNTVFFQWFVAPEGRKVGSLKRRVRSHVARWEMKNCTTFGAANHISKSKCTKRTMPGALLEVDMSKKCTPLWREAHFEVKMYKAPHVRTTLGSWDVEEVYAVVREAHFQVKMHKPHRDFGKVHAAVARRAFPSQNVQSTPRSDYIWKLRCWKSARRCGAKHISKSKCTKYTFSEHFLKLVFGFRGGRRGFCTLWKGAKTWGFCSRFNYNHHYTTLRYATLYYTTLHTTPLHSTPLHHTTLHYNYNYNYDYNYNYTYTTLHDTTLD